MPLKNSAETIKKAPCPWGAKYNWLHRLNVKLGLRCRALISGAEACDQRCSLKFRGTGHVSGAEARMPRGAVTQEECALQKRVPWETLWVAGLKPGVGVRPGWTGRQEWQGAS